MISIRAATGRDAVAIAHVQVQSWRTTHGGIVPEEYLATLNEAERVLGWRDWLTRDIRVFVADLDGEIVGFIVFSAEGRFATQSSRTSSPNDRKIT
jgi:hypothetical protein